MENVNFLFFLCILFFSCETPTTNKVKTESTKVNALIDKATLNAIFEEHQATGTFVLHALKTDQSVIHNEQRATNPLIPASTYKIPHSLIALETAVLADEEETWPWDGQERSFSQWNRDHNLRSGIRYSVVWFYQEVARRVGRERMQEWLDKMEYGNRDISGPIDQFWLQGQLRISARAQVDFLKKLYQNQLPFSQGTMDIVKDIMIQEEEENYVLRAKTGWAISTDPGLGWYVGWVEEGEEVYFFALNIDILKNEDTALRQQITRAIFQQMGLLQASSKSN